MSLIGKEGKRQPMKWASVLSGPQTKKTGLKSILADCCARLSSQLGGAEADLCIVFVSPHFLDDYGKIAPLLLKHLPAATLIGCSAGGLIGGGREIEHGRAIALTAALLPGTEIKPFHLTDSCLPDLDDGPDKWEKLLGVTAEANPSFLLLPDPFSFKIDTLVQGLDFAFPQAVKIGGLASGAHRPGLNALFLNDSLFNSGMVGVSLSGNLVVDSVVAQGCRPIAQTLRVTRCQKNFLFELDGKPAVAVLHEILSGLTEPERAMARNSLFLGVVMDEFKESFQPGDFLIRNILGVEPSSGALVVGEILREERTVQFHLRDAAACAKDLCSILKQYRDSHAGLAEGALLFSCLGRGENLYGIANHDSDCFRQYLGPVPLGGFFTNGEIGPVGGTTFLHGYTSSFGIFRSKESSIV